MKRLDSLFISFVALALVFGFGMMLSRTRATQTGSTPHITPTASNTAVRMYMPVIKKDPSPTPTNTPIETSTPTPTETATPLPPDPQISGTLEETITAGTSGTYSLTVTNNGDVSDRFTFSIVATDSTIPGLSYSVSPSSAIITPGNSRNIDVIVTSSSSSPAGADRRFFRVVASRNQNITVQALLETTVHATPTLTPTETSIPSMTPTTMPTVTPTAMVTPISCTARPTNAPNYPVRITRIDKAAEIVYLRNQTDTTIGLDGWTMCSITGGQQHLGIGGTLGPAEERGFHHSGSAIWDDENDDDGVLYDNVGRAISYFND
jgi:hypothetical protein